MQVFFYEFDTFSFTQPTIQMHLLQQQQQQPFMAVIQVNVMVNSF